MKTILFPGRSSWNSLIERPAHHITSLFDTVCPIFDAVRAEGDKALFRYEAQFDRVELESLRVNNAEMTAAAQAVDTSLRSAIQQAHDNIARFHRAQRFDSITIETAPGVVCEQRAVAIERVGLYIPCGSAPLFSTVLMLAVPAHIAGCREVVLCTPPNAKGEVNPAILYAAQLCGVRTIFKIGGAQAVAAMALGTESVPKVDKIFGPGNAYVMAAKQWASLHGVAIDMPAGPSEVEVIADATCSAAFVAADLLSQAEHGPDSQVVLVATSEDTARAIATEVDAQLARLPRKEIAEAALKNSRAIVLESTDDIVDFTNAYAPEHLIIATMNDDEIAHRVTTAGSVFLGNWSCESAGDYASGTNHTLPTSGYARAYSGLSLDSFQRKMTLQRLMEDGIRAIGKTVVEMARAEQLDAHAAAMQLRVEAVEQMTDARHSTTQNFLAGLVRRNIETLAPYSCARDEFDGGDEQTIFLDANESPFGEANLNRYPDPLQKAVKEKIAAQRGIAPSQIVLGNGSDEIIDLVFRIFCEPRRDNIVTISPSYGMYEVCAEVNDVVCRKVPLRSDYAFCADDLLAAVDANTKAIFLCSPNNPSGNLLPDNEVQRVLDNFAGIIVIDEAYIDFSPEATWRNRLNDYPRLIILSTFSKAWASAAIRLGMAFAHPKIVQLMNKVKYPYNINELTQRHALTLLNNPEKVAREVAIILKERTRLTTALSQLPIVEHVYPSAANFLLVRVNDANHIYQRLAGSNIIVRNRHRVTLCENCLRITIGTPEENDLLLQTLKQL